MAFMKPASSPSLLWQLDDRGTPYVVGTRHSVEIRLQVAWVSPAIIIQVWGPSWRQTGEDTRVHTADRAALGTV